MPPPPDITAELERELLLGRFAPGDKFPTEHALCERFGCSRTPVREALKKLEAAGLLIARHGSGTYVADRSHERVAAAIRRFGATGHGEEAMLELMETRRILETGAVWAAAEAAAKDPSRAAPIAEALAKMDALIAKKASLRAFAEADVVFHQSLALGTGNPLSIAIHQAILPALRDYIVGSYDDPAQFTISQRDHRAVYRAITAGDPAAAVRALHAHLQRSITLALKRIAKKTPFSKQPRS